MAGVASKVLIVDDNADVGMLIKAKRERRFHLTKTVLVSLHLNGFCSALFSSFAQLLFEFLCRG